MEQIKTILPYVGFAETKQGGRRENQDYYIIEETPVGLLAVVCDGMGGGPGGKTASSVAAHTIVERLKSVPSIREPEKALRDAINDANRTLRQMVADKPELNGMGTTVVALLISEEVATVAHVGDSRLYHLRGNKCIFVTQDHSKVAEMVRAKVLTEEQARLSSISNVITRALGVFETCEVEIDQLPYEKGDRFVLCSDGVWGIMPAKELVTYFTHTKSLPGSVDRISVKVDELGFAAGGGHDNHTIVLLETKINSIIKQKMSSKVKFLVYALTAICCLSLLFNIVQYCSSDSAEETSAVKKNVTTVVDDSRLDVEQNLPDESQPNESVVTEGELRSDSLLNEDGEEPVDTAQLNVGTAVNTGLVDTLNIDTSDIENRVRMSLESN